MAFEEYAHVRIIASKIEGIIVDVFKNDNRMLYTVESDKKGVPGGVGESDSWKRFVCAEEDIELI